MDQNRFPKKTKDIFEETINKKKETNNSAKKPNFSLSFEDFDCTQKSASSFKDWQKIGLLSTMLDVLRGYCCKPLLEQLDGKKFTIYGDFPPSDKTKFNKPLHVHPDANWGRIHINGKTIIAGHIVSNTFYIVFLDKHHHFYISEKKGT